ncbi:MAG TPA: SDR family NAD(P)-dependent oxidoreductase [bacterium]|nr:SDR family NAD(P)-dependent oxidoreductase [bacterium]
MANGTDTKTIAIVGVGPGLGASLARRFAREGFAVALLARRAESLEPVSAELRQTGARVLALPTDGTQPAQVLSAFSRIKAELGAPDVLVYNAGNFFRGGILELTPQQFVQAWEANCLGAFLAAQQVLPDMVARKAGTILLTGATGSLRGGARFACLAVGKFGLRALGQSMAREFGPQGVHVAHVVVDGQIDNPRTQARYPEGRTADSYLSADAIADIYWDLHAQHPTTWTHELDLRPYGEKF